jgi:acetolactate synthase-1/3 small subunit
MRFPARGWGEEAAACDTVVIINRKGQELGRWQCLYYRLSECRTIAYALQYQTFCDSIANRLKLKGFLAVSAAFTAMRHIISILLQNEAGALARVASLFSTRGYNIESLSVAPTDDPQFSRLTMVSIGSDQVISQISKQLFKLVDVVNIADMTMGDHIERELLLLKVSLSDEQGAKFRELVSQFDARVLDDSLPNFTLEMTGTGNQLDGFIDRARSVAQILAVVRSGPLAVARGQAVMSKTL